MKLFGNSKRSKHAGGRSPARDRREETAYIYEEEMPPVKEDDSVNLDETKVLTPIRPAGEQQQKRRKGRRMSLAARIAVIVLLVLCVLAILLVAAYKFWVKPPDVSPDRTPVNDVGDDTTVGDDGSIAGDDVQQPDDTVTREKYTFVVVGTDKVSGSTDTIMVATFDARAYTLDIVSIPRDTLVNVSWNTKKVNTLYSSGGMERLKSGLADILGYEVDFYVAVSLDAFVTLIDAIGGVEFDVPKNMNYDDDVQNLHIHVNKGLQLLDGKTALDVMRFRKGYSNADIGRIETQQNFLKAAASQLLAKADQIPISTLATTFIEDVDTDLTYGNVIWFAKEALKMDIENISFHTLPGNTDDAIYVGGWVSYVTIYVDEWLDMVNEYLNPFEEEITVDDVNILTRDSSGKLYATSGVKEGNQSWGTRKPSGNTTGSNSNNNNNNNTGNTGGTGNEGNTGDPGGENDAGGDTGESEGGNTTTPETGETSSNGGVETGGSTEAPVDNAA